MRSRSPQDLSFRLPLSQVVSFPALLEALETRGAELRIQGYGVSLTTLEEVFLNIAAAAAAAGARGTGGVGESGGTGDAAGTVSDPIGAWFTCMLDRNLSVLLVSCGVARRR